MRILMTIASGAALAALSGSVVAAQDANETAASRSYPLDGFDRIAVIGPHHVIVSVGPTFSIRAEGSQQTFADTIVEVEDGKLKIHPIDDGRWEERCGARRESENWRCSNDYEAATFHITLPRIEGAQVVGGGDMRIDRVHGDDFAASVAGSGDLQVADLRVAVARLSVAGSGDLTARGSATRSRVSIAGSGNLHAREVTSNEASITIAGSGNAELTVHEDARVSIVGSGDVDITGSAKCSVSRFGAGKVRCGGQNIAS